MSTSIEVKIRKLLQLSESCNEHEAQQALLKAQELILEHAISEAKLEPAEIESVRLAAIHSNYHAWATQLMLFVSKQYGTYIYVHNNAEKKKQITVVGQQTNINLTIDVFNFLYSRIKKLGPKKYLDQKSYALGFVAGLYEAVTPSSSGALVLHLDGLINMARDTVSGLKSARSRVQYVSDTFYRKGITAGLSTDLNNAPQPSRLALQSS